VTEIMATYVISDIHGCFDEFTRMLEYIHFSSEDRLYLAGDYIDRGLENIEMLKWLKKCPVNVFPIAGNHDSEFVQNIHIMKKLDQEENLRTDPHINSDACKIYASAKHILGGKSVIGSKPYDYYGTIEELIHGYGVTFSDLCSWAAMIAAYPFYYRFRIKYRDCIIVHAGFTESEEVWMKNYSSEEDFYLHAREDGMKRGGAFHGLIISGHTPTSEVGKFSYNEGRVFRLYDETKDCIFYDIDCGCAYRKENPAGRLACIRLEDEKIFYM